MYISLNACNRIQLNILKLKNSKEVIMFNELKKESLEKLLRIFEYKRIASSELEENYKDKFFHFVDKYKIIDFIIALLGEFNPIKHSANSERMFKMFLSDWNTANPTKSVEEHELLRKKYIIVMNERVIANPYLVSSLTGKNNHEMEFIASFQKIFLFIRCFRKKFGNLYFKNTTQTLRIDLVKKIY